MQPLKVLPDELQLKLHNVVFRELSVPRKVNTTKTVNLPARRQNDFTE